MGHMTVTYPTQYLTITQYAEHIGKSRKSVVRYVEAGQLEGQQKIDGVWMIPADTAPPTPAKGRPIIIGEGTGALVSAPPPARARQALEVHQAPPTADERLDAAGYLVSLEDAALIIGGGITPGEVASLRRDGVLEGHRLNGRWRITRASIRALG